MTRMLGVLVVAGLLLGCAPPETRLEVQASPQKGDRVEVAGATSLPDGAQLNVSLHRNLEDDPVVVALPIVKNARYEALLDAKSDLPGGTYWVRVEFSPKAYAWSKEVRPAVGENGEKLGGPHVKQSGEGFRYLQIDRQVALP